MMASTNRHTHQRYRAPSRFACTMRRGQRSTYVLVASATLALLVWQWRAVPDVVWAVRGDARWAIWAVSGLGLAIILLSTFLTVCRPSCPGGPANRGPTPIDAHEVQQTGSDPISSGSACSRRRAR